MRARQVPYAVVLSLLLSCSPWEDPSRGTASSARSLIVDEFHNGGPRGFAWLPPIVPSRPAVEGTLDRAASPTVQIDELDGAGAVTRTIAVFTKPADLGPSG